MGSAPRGALDQRAHRHDGGGQGHQGETEPAGEQQTGARQSREHGSEGLQRRGPDRAAERATKPRASR